MSAIKVSDILWPMHEQIEMQSPEQLSTRPFLNERNLPRPHPLVFVLDPIPCTSAITPFIMTRNKSTPKVIVGRVRRYVSSHFVPNPLRHAPYCFSVSLNKGIAF